MTAAAIHEVRVLATYAVEGTPCTIHRVLYSNNQRGWRSQTPNGKGSRERTRVEAERSARHLFAMHG